MLPQLPEISIPKWLENLSTESIMDGRFPLREVLRSSLYYPSSGFDGDPVRYLAGNILSFIYVDYGYGDEEFMDALSAHGFRGYDLLAVRFVTEEELTPRGWRPTPPNSADGDPPRASRRDQITPFCVWSVFQRHEDAWVGHGPFRFSLLYLCADGVAAFQALYTANSAVPKGVAIIQPGYGFGGNYTDFANPEHIFARSVLGNPSGQPKLLLYGGFGSRDLYRQSCWPNYPIQLCFVDKTGGGSIGIWSK